MSLNSATAPSHTLPALSEVRWLRFATFSTFYIAQGFPIGLFSLAMPAWLLERGMSTTQVAGFTFISSLPWTFKLVAAPLMDRYSFLPMGRRRPWILAAQIGVTVSSAMLLTVVEPISQLTLLTAIAFAINAFSASQDVAVDGMAIDILPAQEQGRANSFMMGGQVLGYSLSGALSATLLAQGGVPLAGAALVSMVVLVTVVSLLFRERRGERLLPWTAGVSTLRSDLPPAPAWRIIVGNLLSVTLVPMSLLLVLVEFLYRSSAGVGLVLYPNVGVQMLGYPAEQFSWFLSASSANAAVLGLVIGLLIDRAGAVRMLKVTLLLSAGLHFAIGTLHAYWTVPGFAPACMLMLDLVGQSVMVSIIALFMSVCHPAVAATQFAVYMAIANLGRSSGAAAFPLLDKFLEAHQMFYAMSAAVLIAAALMTRFDRHRMVRSVAAPTHAELS